jgi:hypothetical protein
MAYNAFTLSEVRERFGLALREADDLFAEVAPVTITPWLREAMDQFAPIALALSTEKARSEMIIAPILLEIRRKFSEDISLFSGIEFNVDSSQGLIGFCDFMFSLSSTHFSLEAPVIAIVEAKNENLKGGFGQCAAEMIASRIFNQKNSNFNGEIYGIVTTGSAWKFLVLRENTIWVDLKEYYLDQVETIVGILSKMVDSSLICRQS